MPMESRIVYFDKPGWRCTDHVLAICRRRADELVSDGVSQHNDQRE